MGLSLSAINNELGSHVRTDGNVNIMLQLKEGKASKKSVRVLTHFIHLAILKAWFVISSSKDLWGFISLSSGPAGKPSSDATKPYKSEWSDSRNLE